MEQIAITGIGCRLPGGTNSPADLWSKLLAGVDLITETPPDRWNVASHFHASRAAQGRTYAYWGGYATDPSEFDAGFFGLTPREAARLDPQQRWLLEAAWEALEDAGIPPAALAGTNVGVFIGISTCDYSDIQKRGRYEVDVHTTSGSALSIAANRISYLLDLRGPSLSVDTACSSSLVALDLACQAIWRGDVSLALIGGANAILGPDVTVSYAKGGYLSPTGRCRAFDAAADGFVRAEGTGVVVLKPMSQALAAGDRIYAVIHATLTNQDGRTPGLTVPSVDQQAAMLVEVYRRAGVRPDKVGYVEAHGTGTAVGDPIEAAAIGRVLGVGRSARAPLWIGSVKSNLGHLEAGSGVTGLIKLALTLYHRTIPPNLHFKVPNPRIPFAEYGIRVPSELIPWQGNGDGVLYGGVNSFGFGGTNAHAVLSSAPRQVLIDGISNAGPQVWTVSARSPSALTAAARNDAGFLQTSPPTAFADLAGAVRERRSQHPHRIAVIAETAAAAAEKLTAWTGGTVPSGLIVGEAQQQAPPVAIIFSGQGTQWPGMARELFLNSPSFRATVEELDAIMQPSWRRSLIEEVLRVDESIFEADVGQPVLFALQVGLFRLYADWGIRPAMLFGHSFGEVAAAYAAGALTLADAALVIVERAKALELTRGAGVMAAVGISAAEAEPLLAAYPDRLTIAAFNSPVDLSLAGDEEAIRTAVAEVTRQGRFARLLPFPYAFHSSAIDACREVFVRSIAGLQPRPPSLPLLSTVTASEMTDTPADARHWWRNLRQPVQFSDTVLRAAEMGAKVFLEIGPHPGLVRYVRQVLGDKPEMLPLGSLRRNEPALACLLESVCSLHAFGAAIDWKMVIPSPGKHVPFPKYPWQRQKYWTESHESCNRRLAPLTHPLLGKREPAATNSWETCLSTEHFSYLAEHGFRERAVFPAAGHIELMLAAVADGSFGDPVGLADVNFDRALWVDQPQLVQTTFEPNCRRVTVSARPVGESGRGWEVVSRGVRWAVNTAGTPTANPGFPGPPADAVEAAPGELYERFEKAGHYYGPLFRTVRRMWVRGDELWADVALDAAVHAEADHYYLHPALLDGVFQSALRATPRDEERDAMFLPIRVERIEWRRRAGAAVRCHVRKVHMKDVRWFADLDIFTPGGELVARLRGCTCAKRPQELHLSRSETKAYQEAWVPAARQPAATTTSGAWLIVDPSGTASKLVRTLDATGAWVGHQTNGTDRLPELLARTETRRGVVVWLAGTGAEQPSVAAVARMISPLLKTGQLLAGLALPAESELWLVTAGATWGQPGFECEAPDLVQAPVAALLRTVATELPELRCRLLDLDPATPQEHAVCALGELTQFSTEDEIAYRRGNRFASRLQRTNLDSLTWRSTAADHAENFELGSIELGSLDGLAWTEVDPKPLADHEIEVEVRAIGLNFRDVLKALDAYPLQPTEARTFGDECAGLVRRVGCAVTDFRPGDEVVTLAAHGFSRRARVPAILAARKPANLSLEQAATIPIAFLTADYCLRDVGRLSAGESVLIHAAAGGVGQAAIQIARRIGAAILGTASPEKHEFLRAQGVDHLFHSRNLSFAEEVMRVTGGEGVDVALNSLSGDFIARTLEILKPEGRFVEIGKKDIFQNSTLDLQLFRPGISLSSVDMASLVARKPEWIGQRLRDLMGLFADGSLTPLTSTTFSARRMVDAFRLMAQGKHRGKLVITFGSEDLPERVLCHHRPIVRPNASYLITGGLSGLGLRTAQWLADHGARWLVLAGRSGVKSDAAQSALDALAARCIRVEIVRCDVADPAAVKRLVQSTECGRPPLRGIIHGAMVLQDEPLPRLKQESLEKVLAPKVAGAWNLHLATQKLPLDWFVLYSSVATLLGPLAQGSYVAANRFLDALAWHRRTKGLPALALNWGPIADVGVVADHAALARYIESVGFSLLPLEDVFGYLKFLLRREVTTLGIMRADWAKFRDNNPVARKLARLQSVLEIRAAAGAGGSDALAQLLALPAAERPALLLAHLRRALAAVLHAEEETLSPSTPLGSFGVDSLMAFEFKLRIDRDFKANISGDQLSAGTSLMDLTTILLQLLTEGHKDSASHPAAAPSTRQSIVSPPRSDPVAPTVSTGSGAKNFSPPGDESGLQRVLKGTAANVALQGLSFDAAALLYISDRVSTVGGVPRDQFAAVFGQEPFISHVYELSFGRIGVISLPLGGQELFGSPKLPDLIRKAGEIARHRGARCISLTGLIPSATKYGRSVQEWLGDPTGLRVTTGHATTTAAVVLNLASMLKRAGRRLEWEHLAVLGLGSIGQSCLALLLEVLPHPSHLTLCDVFTKHKEARALAKRLRTRHGYRGLIRVLVAERGLPEDLYDATTILTAVSVPEVLDMGRLRSGTILVDDSYPPAFSLEQAVHRAETKADLFFSNAGMVRLEEPLRETVFLPPGAEQVVLRVGEGVFRRELVRDPRELTACILSALLTDRHEGMGATTGIAATADLLSHHRGLIRLGIKAARPQCGTYFMPDELIERFRARFTAKSDGRVPTSSAASK